MVIPPLPKVQTKTSSPPIEDPDEEHDSAVPKRPSRRAKKGKRIVISDDEGGDSASDYDQDDNSKPNAESGQTTDSEDEDMSADGDESDASDVIKPKVNPRAKPKPKPRPKPKAARKSKKAEDTEDEMDVDEAPSKGKQGKKRKSDVMASEDEDEGEKPKKKTKKEARPKISRAAADPWKLNSSSVKKNWKEMQAPPLEIFHFHRLVIDEYTYLDGKTHSLITSLQATCRWVLSGTPPVHDFPSLKTIAVFLDIHLGIDDDGEGQSAQVKKRRREQTGESSMYIVPTNLLNLCRG